MYSSGSDSEFICDSENLEFHLWICDRSRRTDAKNLTAQLSSIDSFDDEVAYDDELLVDEKQINQYEQSKGD